MEFQAYDIAIVPVIIAIVGLIGKAGVGPRFLPLVSVALGLLAGFFYVAPGDPLKAIFIGIVLGLTATGAYSGVKNTVQSRDSGDSGNVVK